MMNEENNYYTMLGHISDMYEKCFSIIAMYKDMEKTLPELPCSDEIKPKLNKVLEIVKNEDKSLTEEFKKQYDSFFAFYKKCMESSYVLEKAIFDLQMETDSFYD